MATNYSRTATEQLVGFKGVWPLSPTNYSFMCIRRTLAKLQIERMTMQKFVHVSLAMPNMASATPEVGAECILVKETKTSISRVMTL